MNTEHTYANPKILRLISLARKRFRNSRLNYHNMTISRDTELGELVLARFDKLVQQGEIIWQESTPRHVSATPFNVKHKLARELEQ